MSDPAEAAPDRRPLKSRSLRWVQALTQFLVARKVSPNLISLAGIVAAVLGFIFLWGSSHGWPLTWLWLLLAAVLVQLRLLCNMFDGLVAVEGGLKSKGGELFNEIPDRVEDTLFFLGAGMACGEPGLGWACAVLAVFTAYCRAFGASLGQGQDFGGPCAKPHRMFLLTVGLLTAAVLDCTDVAMPVLAWFLRAIATLTALTAILRIRRMYLKSP